MLVTGRVGMKDLSGPVGIVSAVDGVYQRQHRRRVISDHPESDEYRDSDHGKPRCDESSAATGTGWRKTGISDH